MTEDSTNILAFNQAVALAEQHCGDNTEESTMSVQSTLEPVSAKQEQGLFEHASYTSICKGPVKNIDITNGKWFGLTLGSHQTYSIADNNLQFVHANSALDLPMYVLYGENNSDDTKIAVDTNSSIANYLWTTGDQQAGQYVLSKLNSIDITCNNFLVTVERDTSGGVQLRDNVVFQIMKCPAGYELGEDNHNAVEDTLITSTQYTTDFGNGLHQHYDFSCGWGRTSDAWFTVTPSSDPKTKAVVYWTLREWINRSGAVPLDPKIPKVITDLTNSDARGAKNNLSYPRFVSVNDPIEVLTYRAINLPNVSNIKVILSYFVEIKAHWSLKYKFVLQFYNELPTLGVNLDKVEAERNKNKKRKLML